MSIRRIGGPKGPSRAPAGGPSSARTTGTAFNEAARAQNVPSTSSVVGPQPLARVQAGEIDRQGYVAAHVEQATSHLKGLPSEQLQAIQQDLKDRCESDPLLKELVDHATT
jgi:hypothetical protein